VHAQNVPVWNRPIAWPAVMLHAAFSRTTHSQQLQTLHWVFCSISNDNFKMIYLYFHVMFGKVHRVFTKGTAGLEGTIRRGDGVLSINGTSLEGTTHGEALFHLHQARMSTQAIVVICRGQESEHSGSLCLDILHQPRQLSMCTKENSVEAGAGQNNMRCDQCVHIHFVQCIT